MSNDRTISWKITAAFLSAFSLIPWSVTMASAANAPAQVRRGEEIAQQRCSACHIVAANQDYPPLLKDPAPSFQDVANRPEDRCKVIAAFCHDDPLGSENRSNDHAESRAFKHRPGGRHQLHPQSEASLTQSARGQGQRSGRGRDENPACAHVPIYSSRERFVTGYTRDGGFASSATGVSHADIEIPIGPSVRRTIPSSAGDVCPD